MLFSSITFIYYFLPLLLLIYFVIPNKYKNLVLLIFSLLFYFLGEPKYIIVLLSSCFINYYLSKQFEKSKRRKLYLIISLIYNIGNLLVFKYTDFFISNINQILNTKIMQNTKTLNLFKIMLPFQNKMWYNPLVRRGVAQFGSALDWGSRGRKFKSCRSDHFFIYFYIVLWVDTPPRKTSEGH